MLKKAQISHNTMNPIDFKSLVNGVFQAEGRASRGGYFVSLASINFRPLWFISQNASPESIRFFGLLFATLSGPLSYAVEVTPSGYWHIRIQCRDWKHLINVIFPYFSELHPEKYVGILKLIKIYELLNTIDKTITLKTLVVTLAYSITSSGNRKTSLIDKIIAVNGSTIIPKDIFITVSNTTPININWILGFIIGDGNIYMRIRDTLVGLEFTPILRITQKNTVINIVLFHVIIDFLATQSINAIVDRACAVNLELRVSGKNNVSLFIKLLSPHGYFWKGQEFYAITKMLFLLNLNIKH